MPKKIYQSNTSLSIYCYTLYFVNAVEFHDGKVIY